MLRNIGCRNVCGMAIIMFLPYLSQFMSYPHIKCQRVKLDNEGQRQEGENKSCAIRLQMFESILVITCRILAIK